MKLSTWVGLAVTTVWVNVAQAAAPAIVVYVQGNAKVIHAQGGEQALALGSEVSEADTLVTDDAAQVRVRLFDRSVLRLGPNSRAQLTQLSMDPNTEKKEVSVKLVFGRLWASVTKLITPDSRFEVQAANAVAGVRGTLTGAEVDPNQPDTANFFTIHGDVEVTGADGSKTHVPSMTQIVSTPSGLGQLLALSNSQLNMFNDNTNLGGNGGGGGGGGQWGQGGGRGGGRDNGNREGRRGDRDGGRGDRFNNNLGSETVLRNRETASTIRERALERLRDGQARLRAKIDLRE